MREVQKVDLGSIKIHKKVIVELTESALSGIEGVRLAPRDFWEQIGDSIGLNISPAIGVIIDKNNQVTIDAKICIPYGSNIPDIARQVQDAVRCSIEQSVEIDLKEINVNIQGIERRSS